MLVEHCDFFLIVVFVLDANLNKSKEWWSKLEVSIEDGMGGERNLEATMVRQEMQVSAEDMATLVAPKIV